MWTANKSDSTRNALYKLYTYAKPKSEHDMGLVFDPAFYYEALNLYDEKCSQFKYNSDRYTFWNIYVEEWLAACLGTRFQQAHSQGLGNVTNRSGCVLLDGSSYFAFRRPVGSISGHDIFVGYFGKDNKGGAGRISALRHDFLDLCQAITKAGQLLCSNLQAQEISSSLTL